DAFGNEEFAEVKYKVLTWWQCGLLMVAETVSLGVLSLPAAVATLGLVPAIILLLGLGILATYTGYVIGQFKMRYPHVVNMADAGEIIAGSIGREVVGAGQLLFMVFIMGSHLLTFTVAMNSVTNHGTCTIVFGVVGLIASFICNIPRTMTKISWLSLISFISIIAAVLTCMISLGIQKPGSGHVDVTTSPDFISAFSAVMNIVFAFAGHVAYFGFIAELKDPNDFPKALCLLQATDNALYLIAAVVIYRYAGVDVKSPALGSSSPIMQRISYGVALPTILIAGVIYGHVSCKYIYLRLWKGTDRIHKRDFVAVSSWLAIGLVLWTIAWIIAEAIPVFSNLLSLIVRSTALFGSWFTYGLSAIFWLFMNKGVYFSSKRKIFLTLVNIGTVGLCLTLCGLGLYVSGKAIHDDSGSKSFSCANNA
ncbi:hypothetical protein ASPWEDRAFT_79820, partial [Aspergillus wentii DTO 134E9]